MPRADLHYRSRVWSFHLCEGFVGGEWVIEPHQAVQNPLGGERGDGVLQLLFDAQEDSPRLGRFGYDLWKRAGGFRSLISESQAGGVLLGRAPDDSHVRVGAVSDNLF